MPGASDDPLSPDWRRKVELALQRAPICYTPPQVPKLLRGSEVREQVERAWATGAPVKAIALHLGVSYDHLRRIVKQLKLDGADLPARRGGHRGPGGWAARLRCLTD